MRPRSDDSVEPASAPPDRLAEWWQTATHVLVGAGAGLSVAAGIDYGDREDFARLFPALVKRGFSARYQLIGFDAWSEADKWGYWALHVHDVRFTTRVSPVYASLLTLLEGKDYFVLTSNVDAMFARHGFDHERIYTPQGDYAALQCLRPCSPRVWPTEPIVRRLLPEIDPTTQSVGDPSCLPACPGCGGPVFPNVRAGAWFLENPYAAQATRFERWLRASMSARLLVVEFGAGFNTPGVVRWPDEAIVRRAPRARFIRINIEDATVPSDLLGRALGIARDAATVIAELGLVR